MEFVIAQKEAEEQAAAEDTNEEEKEEVQILHEVQERRKTVQFKVVLQS